MKIKRAYAPVEDTDGYRILVDRLWPRGISKEKAKIDLWLKSVAPSNDLRKWFGHDPERFPEFSKRYQAELEESGALDDYVVLLRIILTLLCSLRPMMKNITTLLFCSICLKQSKHLPYNANEQKRSNKTKGDRHHRLSPFSFSPSDIHILYVRG